MAIRIKNLDLNVAGNARSESVRLGDVTASGNTDYSIFAAPIDCKINYIDVYSQQSQAGASSIAMTITARLATNSGATLQVRSTSATQSVSTSDSINPNVAYRLTPSANNSLTAGTLIELNFSQQGSAQLSSVLVSVNYTPLKHKATK